MFNQADVKEQLKKDKEESTVDTLQSTHIEGSESEFLDIQDVNPTLDDISSEVTEGKVLRKQAVKNLTGLSESLYTYKFKDHPFYQRIEVGTNHIVIYPHPTQVGRKLLACMVGAAWDERNYSYFNVYEPLLMTGIEPGVEFVLDHAGYKYSNVNFNSFYNQPRDKAHFHPKDAGGYHAHYYYGWQFSGLMAVQSILALGTAFLDQSESKEVFQKETVACLDDFNQYVSTILLGTIPFHHMQDNEEMQRLKTLLEFIRERGLFSLKDNSKMLEIAQSLTISDGTFKAMRRAMIDDKEAIKDDTITNILRSYIFDLNTIAKNIGQMANEKVEGTKFHHLGDKESVEQLFKLACCLQNPETSLEFLSTEELEKKVAEFKPQEGVQLEKSQQDALDLVKTEIRLRKLKERVDLNETSQLLKLREGFASTLSTKQIETNESVDKEMVGYRSRIAERFDVQDSLSFKSKDVLADEEKVVAVHRVDTAAAMQQLESNTKKTPSRRDMIAAEIFESEEIMYFTINAIREGSLEPKFWELVYAEIVNRVSPSDEVRMTTHCVRGVLEPQANLDFSQMLPKIAPLDLSNQVDVLDSSAVPQLEVRAHWYKASEKPAKASSNANVFGQLGTFEVLEDTAVLDFPVVDATSVPKDLLESYGVSLHSLSEVLSNDSDATLYATEYEFKEDYMQDYVLQAEGGGGLFVETHSFPHFFIPMEESCQGGFIVGKQIDDEKWSFISLKVPCGSVLKVGANVIHNDSFCVGHHTIALTAARKADSVLLRKNGGEEMQMVQQHHVQEQKTEHVVLS
ncbi:hypothetical protein BN59_02242 [Legionella massiliensis]|uniref:Uncharacterized protein n=1 Tax=Legionella massiliensis TaxID=1034943 RepID=A0A078KYF0_9GAMM|nr:hypothetical protein [Legionella massiliensis]CDZ77946.1 hypothetical protein BN59_02242 [Legionella massiliensis]CEE13684.1 hypothetical protein BN1094_02242 [Legionella massiliensis]